MEWGLEKRIQANRTWMHLWFCLYPDFSPGLLLFILFFSFLYTLFWSQILHLVSAQLTLSVLISIHFQSWIMPLFCLKACEYWPIFLQDLLWLDLILALIPSLTSLLLHSLTLAVLRGRAWVSFQSFALVTPSTSCSSLPSDDHTASVLISFRSLLSSSAHFPTPLPAESSHLPPLVHEVGISAYLFLPFISRTS